MARKSVKRRGIGPGHAGCDGRNDGVRWSGFFDSVHVIGTLRWAASGKSAGAVIENAMP